MESTATLLVGQAKLLESARKANYYHRKALGLLSPREVETEKAQTRARAEAEERAYRREQEDLRFQEHTSQEIAIEARKIVDGQEVVRNFTMRRPQESDREALEAFAAAIEDDERRKLFYDTKSNKLFLEACMERTSLEDPFAEDWLIADDRGEVVGLGGYNREIDPYQSGDSMHMLTAKSCRGMTQSGPDDQGMTLGKLLYCQIVDTAVLDPEVADLEYDTMSNNYRMIRLSKWFKGYSEANPDYSSVKMECAFDLEDQTAYYGLTVPTPPIVFSAEERAA
jgi:hypothetical protein